jgi:hypothetical protein
LKPSLPHGPGPLPIADFQELAAAKYQAHVHSTAVGEADAQRPAEVLRFWDKDLF